MELSDIPLLPCLTPVQMPPEQHSSSSSITGTTTPNLSSPTTPTSTAPAPDASIGRQHPPRTRRAPQRLKMDPSKKSYS
ncbi:hypothetical protein Y032_0037g3456 [Ancylostoma ceylanicum]|uniref:Uncharacterized protein n=1 Tax=Ancylostoma ceylanicum TaxID=53326 RepID=A0A016ULC4_9BILA|nr:hypothetical protein Y032_0037g3456 [Ancylostoma ceylanicum]